ncbi:HTH marR-type domain-containing protein [Thermococcus nautili]|uniref:MarR family winged helix-turn-helix transcriptional regulator n=1 Tax=Thermococcus nautili TaxID=195522 RepID=UPI0025525F2B|nr:helix-turn-helix domain-containing protein [Thermococcus nautili]CAI1492435.1 HTH marR-type domain-containing protein [Thermococcus nautili]
MTLRKAELKVLLALASGPITLKELARKMNVSKSTLSITLHSLERKGLVNIEGKRPLKAKLADNKATQLLRKILLMLPKNRIPKVISGSRLKVLSALKVEELQPPWLVQLKANVSRATLHRVLNELMEMLIVGKRKEGYFISERFGVLKDFADEYFYLQNSIRAKEFDEKAVLVWSGVEELILATETFKGKHLGNFQLTGLARFSDYGLPLISSGVYHYYWPARELDLEEIVIHTLKAGYDARELLYVIVLLKAHPFNEERLKRLAAKFEISPIMEEVLEFLHGEAKSYPFPSREEVEELCKRYFGGCERDNEGKTG